MDGIGVCGSGKPEPSHSRLVPASPSGFGVKKAEDARCRRWETCAPKFLPRRLGGYARPEKVRLPWLRSVGHLWPWQGDQKGVLWFGNRTPGSNFPFYIVSGRKAPAGSRALPGEGRLGWKPGRFHASNLLKSSR